MKSRVVTFLALLVGFGATSLAAQTRVITGRVTDGVTGDPVVGAEVAVPNTRIRTLVSDDGTFSLGIPTGVVQVLIRRIGYKRYLLTVPAGQNTVDAMLERDVLQLEEVVITGVATGIERRNLANAISTVSAEELERAPAETVERQLQGKIPGANIQSNSGAPGGGLQIQLRGITSLLTATPLYVVDGVIVSDVAITSGIDVVTGASTGSNQSKEQDQQVNRITDLNPADIESIEILKGASASAIYGSKASAGVIIVTTKRGRVGRPQIDFSQRFGFFDLARTVTRQYADAAEVDAAWGAGTAAANDFDPDRNWEEDVAGRNPLSFQSSLSVTGGSEDTRYFVSALWKDDDNVMPNSGFDKQALRVNLDQALGERVSLQVSTNLVRTLTQRGLSGNDNLQVTPWFIGAFTPRFVPLQQLPDGSYPVNAWLDPVTTSNPIQTMNLMTNDEEVWRFIGSGRLEIEAFRNAQHDLRFIGVGGVDRFSQQNEFFFPPELEFEPLDQLPGTSGLTNSASEFFNLSGNAVYTYTGSNFQATTSAGIQYDTRDLNIARIFARNMLGGQQNIDQAAVVEVEETRERREDLGFYLQEEVLLDERLLLTAGFRADQTSGSTQDDKLFVYPKASASYRVPVERGVLDEIKFRVAYGESGNQPVFGQKFTPLDGGTNIEGILGFQVGGATTSGVQPERQREIEGGFDAQLADGRASLEFTVFHRRVSDLLLTRGLHPSSGFSQEVFNGGKMRVYGFEAGLTLLPAQSADVSWVTRWNFGLNRSKITDLPVPAFVPPSNAAGGVFGPGLGAFFIEEGASATQIIGNVPPGELGKVGDSNPDFRVGLANDLTWRNLNLFFLFDWQQGSEVINLSKFLFDLVGTGNWHDCTNAADNPCQERQQLASTDLGATYVEDASFLKLREITLSWDLPRNVVNELWGALRYARLSFSARNLLTFTGYSGMDPEVSNFSNQSIGRNVDVAPFPRTRSFWFGIDLGF